jgi:hypothetical protein
MMATVSDVTAADCVVGATLARPFELFRPPAQVWLIAV